MVNDYTGDEGLQAFYEIDSLKDEPQIRVQGWATEERGWTVVFKKGDHSASIFVNGTENGLFYYELRDLKGEDILSKYCDRE